MLIRSFQEAEEIARKVGPKKISVLRAENREFLLALKEAHQRGYGEPVLIGDERKIREIAGEIGFDISKFDVIDSRDPQEIADRGVRLAAMGETHFVLRGYIDGPPLYRSLIRTSAKGENKRRKQKAHLRGGPDAVSRFAEAHWSNGYRHNRGSRLRCQDGDHQKRRGPLFPTGL